MTSTRIRPLCAIAIAGALALFAASASAQTVQIGSATVAAGATASIPVTFTESGANPVNSFGVQFTFTRNPVAVASGVAIFSGVGLNFGCGGNATVNATGTTLSTSGFNSGGGAIASGTICTFQIPTSATAPPGVYPFTITFTEFTSPTSQPVPSGSAINGSITITAGAVGPNIAYNPAAGAALGTGGPVNFTGVTTIGSTGNGQIVATPSGGSGGGTTTVNTCSFNGADAANFAGAAGVNLTFTQGTNTPQNINLTCTSGAAIRTTNLQCTETINGGATTMRFWQLSCPAGAAPVGPNIAYNPAAGAALGTGGPVNFTGVTTIGSAGSGQIIATPSGGAGGGTTTVNSCSFNGADAANFAGAPGVNLTFTAGTNTPQNINLTCTSGAAVRTTNLQCTETIQGGATTMRFWQLSCPAGQAPVGPTIAYNPAAGAALGTGGPVNFTGVTSIGSTGNGQIIATPSGGAAGGTTTVNTCSFNGADAANFAGAAGVNLTFTQGTNTPQNINLTCTSGAAIRTTNLQCTETVQGGATTMRFWQLSCPAGAPAVGPNIAYNPAAGAAQGTGGPVNFTGVTTAGTTGNGQIIATPSGGANGGTTTVNTCSFVGGTPGAFAGAGAVNLTFTQGTNTPQNINLTCTSTAAVQTSNLQCTETIQGGATTMRFWQLSCPAGTVPVGPNVAYNPAAGAALGTGGPVNFTGVTTPGTTGNGLITATPSGGSNGGTTTVNGCSFSGGTPSAFAGAAGVNLTFTAGNNTPQNINLTCTSTAAVQTSNLQCTETITGGATTMRFWQLSCPAGVAPVGPNIAYNPAAGGSAGTGGPVNLTGVTTIGTSGSGNIVATPSGGVNGGTTTVNTCSFSGGNAANFGGATGINLTFTAGNNTPQNMPLTCVSGATLRTTNLQCTETIQGGATTTRFWVVNCPAGTALPLGPTLTYNPPAGASAGTGGPVNFTGVTAAGTTGTGSIIVTPAGGASAGTTTVNGCTVSGTNSGSFFGAGAVNLSFAAGSTTPQTISLTCISGTTALTANLQCTETVTGGATTQRFFVLNCPAGTVENALPVPALSAQTRLLLAAMVLLLGMGVIGLRTRD